MSKAIVKIEKLLEFVWDLSKETEFKRITEQTTQHNIKLGLQGALTETKKLLTESDIKVFHLQKDIEDRDNHIRELIREREILESRDKDNSIEKSLGE